MLQTALALRLPIVHQITTTLRATTIIVHPITTIVATEIVGLYIAQMGLALSPATTSLPTMGQRTSFPHLAKGCSTPQKGGAASMAAKMGASAGHWSS